MRWRLTRVDLVGVALLIGLLAIGRYFGWLSEAPPLLAPGIVL